MEVSFIEDLFSRRTRESEEWGTKIKWYGVHLCLYCSFHKHIRVQVFWREYLVGNGGERRALEGLFLFVSIFWRGGKETRINLSFVIVDFNFDFYWILRRFERERKCIYKIWNTLNKRKSKIVLFGKSLSSMGIVSSWSLNCIAFLYVFQFLPYILLYLLTFVFPILLL